MFSRWVAKSQFFMANMEMCERENLLRETEVHFALQFWGSRSKQRDKGPLTVGGVRYKHVWQAAREWPREQPCSCVRTPASSARFYTLEVPPPLTSLHWGSGVQHKEPPEVLGHSTDILWSYFQEQARDICWFFSLAQRQCLCVCGRRKL